MNARQMLNIFFTLITLAVNGLANALPLNGLTTGEISDRFPVLFVPAGYVFSIWGLIYLGLIAFAVYQALPAQRDNEILRSISPFYWLASIANSVWIFLWHYEVFELTIVAMSTLLLSLIGIYLRLRAGEQQSEAAFRWAVQCPFSIYLSWISVATIANTAQWLHYFNWGGCGLSNEFWTTGMLAMASGLGLAMLMREGDRAYNLVLIWAFAGIAIKQASIPAVANSAWVLALALLAAVLWQSLRGLRVKTG